MALPPPSYGGQTDPGNDLIRLSQTWWGVSFEDFPKVAGLQPGDYSVGDHPVENGVHVIVTNNSALSRWEPRELPPLSFSFTAEEGLREIDGFYKGSQSEVLASLTTRYGSPDASSSALGMSAFGWHFEKTFLDLRYGIFVILPISKAKQ